jgi:hypothetical protein
VTPEERAARDRLAAFLTHPGLRREVEPGDPADVIAVITGRLDMPRLYKSDLRLLLATLDRYDAIEEPARETARYIAEFAERHGPVSERVEVTYRRAPRDLDPPDGSVWGLPSDGHGLPFEDGE